LFDRVHSIFGFTVDAAASQDNALLPRFWTRDQDAIKQDWTKEIVFCNPPFNNIGPFLRKARTARRAVVLVPLNYLTSTSFHRVGADHLVIPRGRIKFVTGKTPNNPVLGTCLLIYGPLGDDDQRRLSGMGFSRATVDPGDRRPR
jgi:phage N-6-adenine-methyltransferase